MSWANGLILWLVLGGIALWVVGELIHDFGTRDDWDYTAERKRQIERKARKISREFQ